MGRDGLTVGGETLAAELLVDAEFAGPADLARSWVLEGPAKAVTENGRLLIASIGEKTAATLWFKGEFEADLAVEYAGITVAPHGACNFNLFLHATELDGEDVLARPKSGAYNEYHDINNYIFTLTPGWSRFRRDPGFNCISENLEVHGEPDVHYRVVIAQQGCRFRAWVNDRLTHDVIDPEPHTRGRIALRTWNTSLAYDTFRVWKVR